MLVELHVSQLGVIEDLTVTFGPGMTVLTGETGAGKTLIVDAIALLLGEKLDVSLVRPGATEAVAEGRFVSAASDLDTVLTRVVPASSRGRAYIDGRMASAQQLIERGGHLIDLHGQHAHQSLLHPSAQRAALDEAGTISTEEVIRVRRKVRDITSARDALGGDARARVRELDLLRYQVDELDAARLTTPTEDDDLRLEEARLSNATALRMAATSVADGIGGDDGIVDRLGSLIVPMVGEAVLEGFHRRLLGLQAELADAAGDARTLADGLEDDPGRLEEVGDRRHVLGELRRKYGETLAEVMVFHDRARARLVEVQGFDHEAGRLEGELAVAREELQRAEERVGAARRTVAPEFASRVEAALQGLAMPAARFAVDIGPELSGHDVAWLLGANPGEPLLPLVKVASGGELARTMLAVRLVLTERRTARADRPQPDGAEPAEVPADGDPPGDLDPPTLVFDEVDAGIGGQAAVAVGRALAALAHDHQILVVTHLPQVAACADRHLVVRKRTKAGRTSASVEEVEGPARVVELSRMLSGRPDSPTARRHAEELLAQRQR